MNNDSDDLEDTHLCIKCNATIVGLSKYIEHRKTNCLSKQSDASGGGGGGGGGGGATVATTTAATSTDRSNLEHSYDGFNFAEPEAPSSYLRKTAASHGGKSSKSPLTDAYEPSYELGADLFFSSLQLQSVSTGGKTGARPERSQVKDEQNWPSTATCSDPLLKAVREQEESDFKPLKFVHSPEASDVEEEEDDEGDDFEGDEGEEDPEQEHDHEQDHDGDEDEDVDVSRRHSPPAVPATHTGGKWRPEQRPQLHHHSHHTHLARISPSWDEPAEELMHDHPPAEHTHGKWVPGSKQLEYRENIDLTKLQSKPDQASYWCNICCRRLKTRLNYEQHLHSAYHQRRAEAERQLEQAQLEGDKLLLGKDFDAVQQQQQEETEQQQAQVQEEEQGQQSEMQPVSLRLRQRRQRRSNLLRCDLCRHSMPRHLMGKHLISHYHYRRLQQPQTPLRRQSALHSILEHMPSIVRQAPFQCLPCRFYANTETAFQVHWRSTSHVQLTERLGGQFWCSYCQFECSSNEQMWQHLLHATHKEVLFALNRSVPVCIAQRRPLSCSLCGASGFLYNLQLRRHFAAEHAGLPATGSASDDYQCRFRCDICGAAQRSRVALQRHEKHKHRLARYYCALCRLEFETPLQARRHRSLMQHRRHPSRRQPCAVPATEPEQDIEHMLREVLEEEPIEKRQRCQGEINECVSCAISFETPQALVEHRRAVHPQDNHACLSCGGSFQSAQALGRHTRSCQPIASSSSTGATDPATAPTAAPSWSCDQCNFSANYESDLLYHRLFHTRGSSAIGKNELLQCPLCPKSFRKHSLRAHLRNHTDERIFECGQCLAKFARRHNLKNHMASMHGERTGSAAVKPTKKPDPGKRFQCGICGKVLAKKYSLKQHELSHTETKRRYRCDFENCSYAGLTPEALKIHMASHAKGSHGCPHVNCNYVGKSELHLKRHLKSHVNEQELSEAGGGVGGGSIQWFSCDQCDFRARIKGHLRRHMLRHTGEKPHQCPHCEFQCSSFDNLRKHIVKTGKHPGKFIYECSACAEQEASNIFKSNSFKEYKAHLATHK